MAENNDLNEVELDDNKSPKNKWVAFALAFIPLTAFLGIDRFYVGKTGSAILKLITFGGCGIWALIDWIKILMGKYTDKEGRVLK